MRPQCRRVELADTKPVSHAVVTGTAAGELPNRRNYDGMMLLDVIEHIEDAVAFLAQMGADIPNARSIIVAVPARQEIWSNYDDRFGHFRRYTREMLRRELEDAGWTPERVFYGFRPLYPAALALLALKGHRETAMRVPTGLARHAHAIVASVLYLEAKLPLGPVPGTSVLRRPVVRCHPIAMIQLEMSEPRSAPPSPGERAAAAASEYALIFACAALLLATSIWGGPPIVNDYPFHFNYMSAFTEQMLAGELYPRWLAALWSGAGGPDLFFYPPLTYWIGGIFRFTVCRSCSADDLLVLLGVLSLSLYGAGIRSLALRYFSNRAAVVAAVLGMALPFHLGTEWGARFAFAEFVVASLIPWHMIAFLDCLAGRAAGVRLALLTTLILLTHVVTAVMMAATYPVLVLALGRLNDFRSLGRLTLAAVAGVGLAAVYWYPAIALLDSVNGEFHAEGFFDPTMWLFWPGSALPLGGKFSAVWPSFLAMSAISLIAIAANPHLAPEVRRLIATLVGFTIFMQTPAAWLIYEVTPVGRIQFPWRFLVIADIAFALAIALVAEAALHAGESRPRRWMFVSCLVLTAFVSWSQFPGTRSSQSIFAESGRQLVELAVGNRSWLPAESPESVGVHEGDLGIAATRSAEEPIVHLVSDLPGASVVLDIEDSRRVVVDVDIPAPARAVFRRTYWRFARGYDEATGLAIELLPTVGFPFTMAEFPAGRARYVLELPMLPEERLGAWISATSLILLLAWSGLTRFRRGS